MIDLVGKYRKAVVAFVGTVLTNVLLVLPQDGGFGDLTTFQWLTVVVTTLGVTGAVAQVPNDRYGRHAA